MRARAGGCYGLGRRSAIAYANGVATAYAHDLLDRLTAITHTPAAGSALPFGYTHDDAGRRVQEDGPTATIPGGTRTFGYDLAGRLETVTTPGLTNLLTYDPAGNRLGETINPGTPDEQFGGPYQPNQLNQYAMVGACEPQYDARGNLTVDWQNIYSYDAFGRLIGVSNSTQGSTWYTYDALDRRVAAGFEPYWPEYYPGLPAAIGYHHDGPEVAVAYHTADWETWTGWDIVNGPGLDEPVMRTDGTSRYYYHADALGSVVALTDNTGAVAEQYRYDAWGHMAAGDGAGNGIVPGTVTGNLTTFTGREYDPIAGLYYYRARYYHPAMGRFISRDPIGEAGGLNLYAYCGNDPVNFWDPFGQEIAYANHHVAFGNHHSKIIITPKNQEKYANHPDFQQKDKDGKRFATIGAGPKNGKLVAGKNREKDVSKPANNRTPLNLSDDKSEDEVIAALLGMVDQYNQDPLPYKLFPREGKSEYNSNSFVSGIGQAAGRNMPSDTGANTPGYHNPVPASRFGKKNGVAPAN